MTISPQRFQRKPFYVEALQVTVDNLVEATVWCSGELTHDADGKEYIKVDVKNPLDARQTTAYPGDWLLKAGSGFKVYLNGPFRRSFDLSEETPTVTVRSGKQSAVVPVSPIDTSAADAAHKRLQKAPATVKRTPVPGPVVTDRGQKRVKVTQKGSGRTAVINPNEQGPQRTAIVDGKVLPVVMNDAEALDAKLAEQVNPGSTAPVDAGVDRIDVVSEAVATQAEPRVITEVDMAQASIVYRDTPGVVPMTYSEQAVAADSE